MPFIWERKKPHDGRPVGFQGRYYYKDPSVNWASYIPIQEIPIQYLEIGCADGGNAIHIANSYCKHSNSKIYCVDPWTDYEEYPEYKGQQTLAWKTFNQNIVNSGHFSKFQIHRGFSDDIVPTFEDNFFDIIFVDGNHETDYVYRDGVNSFAKVKHGGYIVFDDYCLAWEQTMKGVELFLEEYKDKVQVLMKGNFQQAIIQKI